MAWVTVKVSSGTTPLIKILYSVEHLKEHASDQSRILVADLSEMNRREIKKNLIAFKT